MKSKQPSGAGAQSSTFSKFAKRTAELAGRPRTFWTAVLIILIWGITGPLFKYSDTWQLVINTATTIITFLMVFLIQNTQNRDAEAIQIKLDELIRSNQGAHNALLDLEEYDVEELHDVRRKYEKLAERARELVECGKGDTDVPDVPELLRQEGLGVPGCAPAGKGAANESISKP